MPKQAIGTATPERKSLDVEIGRLRGLDVGALQDHWHAVFSRRAPSHVPRHLLFRLLAYRMQADLLDNLDPASQRLLDRSASPEKAGQRAISRRAGELRPGTMLARGWKGEMQRVAVLA